MAFEEEEVGGTMIRITRVNDEVLFNADDIISVLRNWRDANPGKMILHSLLREFIKIKNNHQE